MILLSVSHRQQRQQADCLTACTAMVLDYLHIPFSYDRLMRLLRIQPFGTSFHNLHHIESLGLSVVITQGNMDALRVNLEEGLPAIAFVDTGALTSYWEEATELP